MNSQDIVKQTISNYWNVRDELKGLSLEELRQICKNQELPFAVCAINVTGDLNLGVMMRTASLCGAERFIIYGKHTYDRRSTVGAQNYIELVKEGSIDRGGSLEVNWSRFHPMVKEYGYEPIYFDTGYPSMYEMDFDVLEWTDTSVGTTHKPLLVFGNEGVGLPEFLLRGAKVFTIPQRGVLRSLNVCAAASIAIQYVSHKLEEKYCK